MIVSHPSLIDDLVEFPDVESIKALPNYTADVDPRSVTLKKPIGVYRFRDKIPCGLKSCHTPHFKGLVVQTSEGTAVNIGNICGRKHFGEHFGVLLQMAVRFDQRKFHIAKVRELKAVAGRHKEHMADLMDAPMGAAWCTRARRRFEAAVPSDAIQAVRDLARRGDPAVYEEIRLRGEDAEIARMFGVRSSQGGASREQVRRRFKGNLKGLEMWAEDPGRLLYELQRELDEFLTLDPINCKAKALRTAADLAVAFEGRLKRIEEQLEAAPRFFGPENLVLLRYLSGIGTKTRGFLESLRWDFQAGKPRNSQAA